MNIIPNVKLLEYSSIRTAIYAGLVCTDSEDKIENYTNDFIKNLISSGHESVIEHINYTFELDGISRALLQELARHRHISLSVKSTRWALKRTSSKHGLSYYNVKQNSNFDNKHEDFIILEAAKNEYLSKVNEIINKQQLPNDILKYYMIESLQTKAILSLNARELRLIFSLRTSSRALKEFRDLCKLIYESLPERHKFMYDEFFN